MPLSDAEIQALEKRFGMDQVRVKGKPRRRRRLDDEPRGGREGKGKPRDHGENQKGETPPPPASTAPPTPVTPGVDGKTPGVVTTPVVRKEVTEVTTEKQTPQAPQAQTKQPELEPCPVCGGLKEKERKVADGKTVKLLTCGTCSGAYKAAVEAATKAILADPANAPEPPSKFAWVLKQIDPTHFAAEAATAVAAYREKYNATVVAVVRQRGYLDGNPMWGVENHLRRPQMRFTRASFQSRIAANLRDSLEEKLGGDYKAMRRLIGRLEAASRVEPELRAALAKAAAEAAPPAPETLTPGVDGETPGVVEAPVKKTGRTKTTQKEARAS